MNELHDYIYKNQRILPIFWTLMAVFMLLLGYYFGESYRISILLVLPVILASWYNGRSWGIFFALLLPAIYIVFYFIWSVPWGIEVSVVNIIVRAATLILIAILADLAGDRQRMIAHVKALENLLPICASCKKIRNKDNNWIPIDEYMSDNADMLFSHGLCPDCIKKLYPNFKGSK